MDQCDQIGHFGKNLKYLVTLAVENELSVHSMTAKFNKTW